MDKNNKTLLIAVLIMLLALVSLNFSNISGRATGTERIDILTSTVTCESGPSGVGGLSSPLSARFTGTFSTKVDFREANGNKMSSDRICNRDKCTDETATFRLDCGRYVSGSYYIEGYDRNERTSTRSGLFRVVHS